MYFSLMIFLITICVNRPLTLLTRLPVNTRLLVDIWGESKVTWGFLITEGVSVPKHCIVQASAVDEFIYLSQYLPKIRIKKKFRFFTYKKLRQSNEKRGFYWIKRV